ncbi:MAG: histidine kinase [Bacteroidota bacterium]
MNKDLYITFFLKQSTRNVFFSVVVICLTIFKSYSQDLSYYRIDDEDGLPSNEVYQTIQDQFGFIWIGCDAGLYRYDGFRFVEYATKFQNSRSISNLKLAQDGTIWCQNFTGQILNVQQDSLHVFYDGSKENSQYPAFTIDPRNNIWISSDHGLNVFSKNGILIKTLINDQQKYKPEGWLTIQAMDDQIVGVDKTSHFFTIDYTSYAIKKLNAPANIGSRHMFFLSEDEYILFSEQNPVRAYCISKISKEGIQLQSSFTPELGSGLHYFYETIGGNHFMGTSNGMLIGQQKEGNSKIQFERFLEGMEISDIQLDKEGNYWVSTLQDGILVLPNLQIQVYETTNSILSDKNVYHIAAQGKNLLLGTYSGEIFKREESGSLTLVQSNKNSKFRAIRKIIVHKGITYIACGPLKVDKNSKLNENVALNNIRDMEIMDDRLFFTTPDRTGYVDLNDPEAKVHILRKKGGKKVACNTLEKRVYFACTDGFFCFEKEKLQELKYAGSPLFVSDLYFEGKELWIGTMNDGLFKYTSTSSQHHFKKIRNIQGEKIRSLIVHDEYAWIATEFGLNRYHRKDRSTTLFNRHDGINFLEINDITIIDKTIFLATIRGLITFPTNLRGKNTVAPEIRLHGVKIGSHFMQSPTSIILKSHQHGLTIYLNSTAFRSRGNFHFEYRILNYESEWKKLNASSSFIAITGLPAGNYIFEVVAVNEDGVRSIHPASIAIKVMAPYYLRWWFYLLVAIVGMSLVTVLFLLRIRFIQQRAQAKNHLILSQLTALKAQMNPHFMYNTLSSIQDFIWKNDTKNSNYYLSRFSLLMRKILDASDSTKISLIEEIEILSLYLELEQLRFGATFTFELIVEKNVDAEHINIPAMMIQPFVENAIKHGLLHKQSEKKLRIHFSLLEDKLRCEIEDNGIGREKAGEIKKRQEAQHRSFATKATQKRIELLSLYDNSHYSVTITDLYDGTLAIGTKVDLILPFRVS